MPIHSKYPSIPNVRQLCIFSKPYNRTYRPSIAFYPLPDLTFPFLHWKFRYPESSWKMCNHFKGDDLKILLGNEILLFITLISIIIYKWEETNMHMRIKLKIFLVKKFNLYGNIFNFIVSEKVYDIEKKNSFHFFGILLHSKCESRQICTGVRSLLASL